MAILQDKTKPSYEDLLAMVVELSARVGRADAVRIEWAKDKEGKALALTWPGKRARYIEVAEFRDLRGAVGEQVEAFIKSNKA